MVDTVVSPMGEASRARTDVSEGAASSTPEVGGSGLGHMAALDGIRGLSVLAVVAFHLDRFTGGYLGVDAFFVLSGFLITGLLLNESGRTGRVDLARFYVRRARRLVPALVVAIAGIGVWARWWAVPGQLAGLRGEAWAALFYVANWHTIANADSYWDLDAAPSPFDHMWSLAIEEQFYLLWPLVVLVIVRATRGRSPSRAVGRTAIALAALSAVAMVALYGGGDPNTVYMGTHTRAQAILIGSGLAWLVHRRAPGRPQSPAAQSSVAQARVTQAAGWLAMPALAVMWWRVDGSSSWLYRGGFTVHALLVVAVIAASVGPGSLLGRVLSWRPLRWAGLISYGLYLYHWPVIVFLTPENTGWGRARLDLVRVGVALAVSLVSFFVIERPIRFGSRVTPRVVAIAAPLALVGAAAFAGWAMQEPAIGIERLDDVTIPTAPSSGPTTQAPAAPSTTAAVTPSGSEPPASSTSVVVTTTASAVLVTVPPEPLVPAPGERLRVAYVGDSIGVLVSPYLDLVLGDDVDYVDMTAAGSALCDWFPDLERLVEEPVDVVIVDHGGNALSPCMFDASGNPVTGDAYDAKYRADTAYTAELAARMGARLLLVDQPVTRSDRRSGTGAIFEDAAEGDGAGWVRFVSTWPALSPGGVFQQAAPCEDWEPGCIDGQGELRSPPPGVHLEPLGQFRYALLIRDDLARAGWLPAPVS